MATAGRGIRVDKGGAGALRPRGGGGNRGKALDRARADRFIGMSVNEFAVDYGERSRTRREVLRRGRAAGFVPSGAEVEFAEE